jgi:hypothetical protein
MPGHSRPEGRRALHAYVQGIHGFCHFTHKDVDGWGKPGNDGLQR